MPENFMQRLGGGLQEIGMAFQDPVRVRDQEQRAKLLDAQTKYYNQQAGASIGEERRMAMLQDAYQLNQMLEGGYIPQAEMLLADRLKQIKDLGGDPTHTLQAMQMLQAGDIDGLKASTRAIVDAGAAAKLLEIPGAEGDWEPMAPKVKDSQMIVETAPKQFEARDIAGIATPPKEPEFDAEAQRKYLQDARKGITQLKGNFRETQAAFNKIESAANAGNPTGDLAMTIQLMKLLDPGSVVREGEQQMVRNTASIPDRLWNAYNAAKGEGSLSPEQRKEVLGMAQQFYQGEQMATDVAVFEQLAYANADGFTIERVLGEDAAKRWRRPDYTATAPNGEVISFSLSDVLSKARAEGVRPIDIINRLGLKMERAAQ
jgi:hypothetical protein